MSEFTRLPKYIEKAVFYRRKRKSRDSYQLRYTRYYWNRQIKKPLLPITFLF